MNDERWQEWSYDELQAAWDAAQNRVNELLDELRIREQQVKVWADRLERWRALRSREQRPEGPSPT